MKYKVTVCREIWGTIEVDANNELEAIRKIEDGDYDAEFEPTGKIGNEGIYNAVPSERG